MDHDKLETCDILFLSDSLKFDFDTKILNSFSNRELQLISVALKNHPKLEIAYAASVKCHDVKEADLKPTDREICRKYLQETIARTQPKLIFCCGNLAMVMLVKKSGITEKRGTSIVYTQDNKDYKVIPLYHPMSVILEPKYKRIFYMDIENSIQKYILGNKDTEFSYEVIETLEDLNRFRYFETIANDIAIDTETTGLDFTKDVVTTIAISDGITTIAMPLDHKESKFSSEEKLKLLEFLKKVLSNPKNNKVMHNSKFDIKMLKPYGIDVVNVWDTKSMYHLLEEDAPKSLSDLVKRYFPETMEEL